MPVTVPTVRSLSFISVLEIFVSFETFFLLQDAKISKSNKAIDNFLFYFPQKPFLGTGELTDEIKAASQAVGSSHIHVGYLSHLVYYGIVGCFFLFGFLYLLMKELYNTAKNTNYWGSFFAFMVFLWSFATMSESSIFYPGLIFALIFDKYFRDNIILEKD